MNQHREARLTDPNHATQHSLPDTPVWVALSATPHSIQYVQAGIWRTRVLLAGDPAAPTLVLMAGTGGHLEAYAHNVAAFAEHFYVVAYDYPGHGYTTHATADLELPDYVLHLRQLLSALGIQRAHLNGESLGGWVATKFAASYPDQVLGLVLNTPGGTMASVEVMERIRLLSQAAADEPTSEHIRARLEWLMADPNTVTDELVAIRQTIYARPGFATSMRHILCLQREDVRRRNLISDDDLNAIPHGALVIWTSNDPSGPAAAGISMAEKIPGGRFQYMEGAGHWPQWEQPAVFNQIVLDYLASYEQRVAQLEANTDSA
jgi:2-hydroxy-6-oxonona-2,4-dienedioate hydrolase